MSISIEPTIFKNARTGHETYGIRIYDEYAQFYDNTWENIPDGNLVVLQKVAEMDGIEIREMISFIVEQKEGVTIGGEYYGWETIKDILV